MHPLFLTQHRKIPAVLRSNIHLNLAVRQWLMVDIQFIIHTGIYILLRYSDLHILCVDSHEHLAVRSLVIREIFLVPFKISTRGVSGIATILYYLFNLSLIDCGTSIPNLAIESSLIATSKPDASTLVEGT